MRFLLDTHVLLWWFGEPDRLGRDATAAIEAADRVVVSAASVWEAEIKRAKGKIRFPNDLRDQIQTAGFSTLSIASIHAERAARLPAHHNDPFDRMLVAQAVIEGLTLVTADRSIRLYEIPMLVVNPS